MNNSNNKKIFLASFVLIAVLSFTIFNILPAADAAAQNVTPTAEGSFKQWSLPSGVAYTKVQAVTTADGDTQYITESDEKDAQTFIFAKNLVPTSSTITSITIHVNAEKKSSTSTVNFKIRAAQGITANDGPVIAATTAYVDYTRVMTTNPFTGVAWTASDINNWTTGGSQLSFGMVTSNDRDHTVRVTKMSLEINYVSDTTPPVITPTVTGTLGNNGWYKSNVLVHWTVTDPESAITSPACQDTTISTDTASQIISCSATSTGGTSSNSVTIKRDATAPTISGDRLPLANANGWNNVNVVASFSCADALSGVDTCTTPVTVSTEGKDQSVPGTVTDKAGNTASTSVGSISIDKTAPVLTVPAPITKEATGPTTPPDTTVTFSTSATDNLTPSPIIVCTPASGDPFSYTASSSKSTVTSDKCVATDLAGNNDTKSFDVTITDTTPPIITVNGIDPVIQKVGTPYTDTGASASDIVDVTDLVVTTGTVDTSIANVYQLNYDATDNSGNTAIQKMRTVDIIDLAFANTVSGKFSSSIQPIVTVTDHLKSGSVPVLVQSFDTNTNTVRDSVTITLDEDSSGVFNNNLNPINLVASTGDKLNSNDLVFLGGDQIKATYLGTFTITAGSTADGVSLGAFPGTTPANTAGVRFYESDAYLISQYATLKVNDVTVPLSTSSITAHVISTTDGTGYDVTLVRDSSSATSFTATSGIGFSLTSTTPSTNQIKTKVGDTITATYGSTTATALIISDPTVAVTSVPTYQVNSTVADTCAGTGDKDQDGICDTWEDQSVHPGKLIVPISVTGKGSNYTLTCNTAATLTTDPTGATVCPSTTKRDVYVELDQMQGHKMSSQAIKDVVKAFNNGNTATITGVSSGVTLHIIVDDTVPHFTKIPWNSTDPNVVTVESLKQKYFGFASERIGVKPLPAGIPNNATYVQDQLNKKRQFFHWALMMHDQTETPTSSGRGEKPGNDFVVSMGEFAGSVGTVDQQEATFMHELGHNLGLDHGGLDAVNGKPNEPSVMNYLFQFNKTQSGGVLDRPLDFSRYAYNTINENSVNESKILGSGTLGAKSVNTLIGGFGPDGVTPISAPYVSTTVGKPTVSVDLNQNGLVSKTLYAQNTHYFVGIPGLDDTAKRILNSTNEWANLNLKFRQQSTFRDGVVTIHNTDTASQTDGLIPAADSVAPDVSITAPVPINEGSLYQPDITITDFDSSYWDVVVDYGDGTPTQSAHLTSTDTNVSSIDHTYTEEGDYAVKVTVTSSRSALAGVSTTVSTTIHVNDVAPQVTATANNSPLNEGGNLTGSGSFTDPGTETWTAKVDYNDGSGSQPLTLNPDKTFSLNHKYADNGNYNVMVTVTDTDDNISGTATVPGTVNNVSPTATAGTISAGNEGTPVALTGASFTDPGIVDTPWAVDINWGDGTAHTTLTQATQGTIADQTHTYVDNGTYTVTLTVTDKDSGTSAPVTTTATIANVIPTVSAGAALTGHVGDTVSLSGASFSDLGVHDNPWSIKIDWGDGHVDSTTAAVVGPITGSHQYASNHGGLDWPITITVTDKDGGKGSAQTTAGISNPVPIVITVTPTSEGSFKQWNLPFGAAYTKVQAVKTNDGNTQYIQETDEHERQTFIFASNLVPAGAHINSITIHVAAERSSFFTSSANIALSAAKGATANDGSPIPLTTSYIDYTRVMATNPFTGLAWTASDVNSWNSGGSQLSFGAYSANDHDKLIRITKISLEISYIAG